MDFRIMGMDSTLFSTLQHMMDTCEDTDKSYNAPMRKFVRDAKAMAATPADVKEYPNSYVFVIDMPGLKSGDIKFMRKFALPENANTDAISAVCQDGVLTVTVQKLPPPEPKKPKTIEVKIAWAVVSIGLEF
ncbi:hypothetical protein EZV62_013194 [Acer yangbiense]|uniref:SHSP domain-containing protein n=1 Tax=Acer yangbiense TaxID=1000413 RepID=A0A5C7HXH3_9ROSI|nr:hypothetical protein EZV62_013194 [Acer yangbiense]